MKNRLPAELEVPVYRILQELINNTLKHANATAISIQISRFPDLLNLVVEDNGAGFDPDKVTAQPGGLGLANIKARLHKLHGTINIDSGLGNGSTFIIDVPLNSGLQALSDPEENNLHQIQNPTQKV